MSRLHGKRLKPVVLAVTIGGKNISDFCEMSIRDELKFIADNEPNLTEKQKQIGGQIMKEIKNRLQFLQSVGLDYLTLARSAGTLSGGESQRIRLTTQIGSALSGVLYVLDEPSIGLHQRDNDKLIATLKNLRDLGNTVIVVEHDEDTMRSADYIVDVGPGAGVHGGEIVAAGSVKDICKAKRSITGDYLSGRKRIEVPQTRRPGNGNFLTVKGARENNLRNIDVKFPLGEFVCVTGISGSGKSSLINEILYKTLACELNGARSRAGKCDGVEGLEFVDKVIGIDQQPIGRTPRSNLPPIPACSMTSAPSSPRRRMPKCGATARDGSASTSGAAAARPARATASSKSRCTSCRTSTFPARSARAHATTAKHWKSSIKKRPSLTC